MLSYASREIYCSATEQQVHQQSEDDECQHRPVQFVDGTRLHDVGLYVDV